MTQAPSLSLYIHFPWCMKKCPYCDFNSHGIDSVSGSSFDESAYTAALLNDVESEYKKLQYDTNPLVQSRKLTSIFMGGGTPSLFSADSIGKVLKTSEQRFGFEENLEITLEANPGTVEQQRFIDYRRIGINRLSIGIQSFNDHHLKTLGRIHSGRESSQAVAAAKTAGFSNFNLDLMYGLPGQTVDEAIDDLQQAIRLGPTHISWYQLTLEPNTVFYNTQPKLPGEDSIADMMDAGLALLEKHGFYRYEVSAFARVGMESQHNLNYWRFGDYLGIGAGAHGKMSYSTPGEIQRSNKVRMPDSYIQAIDMNAELKTIPMMELPLEFMMNNLRLVNGFTWADYQNNTGLDRRSVEPTLEQLAKEGLVESTSQGYKASEKGFLFLDAILGRFSVSHS